MTVDSVNESNMISPTSSQFSPRCQCFVRVRIIEILLRRPQPTRNTQATLATKSQLPDPPLLHLQHAKFAFRHNSFLPSFLPKRSLLLLSEVEQHSYFGDKTQPFGPFVWTLFFYLHYFELCQEIFWKSWRKYLPVWSISLSATLTKCCPHFIRGLDFVRKHIVIIIIYLVMAMVIFCS